VATAFPVVDPVARYRMAKERSIERLLRAHDAYWPDAESMADGSPQRIVEQRMAQHAPPLLILQGTADENLPRGSAQRFAQAYREAGGRVRVELFPGEPHAFINRPPGSAATKRALSVFADFVRAPERNGQT
jgi:acetyl esterase